MRVVTILLLLLSAAFTQGFSQSKTFLSSGSTHLGGFEGTTSLSSEIDSTSTTLRTDRWSKNYATTPTNPNSNFTEKYIVRTGSNSLRLNYTSTNEQLFRTPTFFPIPNTEITIQYFRRAESTSNIVQLKPFFYYEQGAVDSVEYAPSYSTVSSPNQWEKVTHTFKASPSAVLTSGTRSYAGFQFASASSGGPVYIDDVCIYTGSADNTPSDPVQSLTASPSGETGLVVKFNRPAAGWDGGGYMVLLFEQEPDLASLNINQNGIYKRDSAVYAGSTKGQILTYTTSTSTSNQITLSYTSQAATVLGLKRATTYWFVVMLFDKAYNYSTPVKVSGTTNGTYYYLTNPADLTNPVSWNTKRNNTGTAAPNFNMDYGLFTIEQNLSFNDTLTFGKSTSRLIIGDGVNPCTVTMGSNAYFQHASLTPNVEVSAGAKLIIECAETPRISAIGTDATIEYTNNDPGSVQSVKNQGSLPYQNLVIRGNSQKDFVNVVNVIVNGNLYLMDNPVPVIEVNFQISGNVYTSAPPAVANPVNYPVILQFAGGGERMITDYGGAPGFFSKITVSNGTVVKLGADLSVNGTLELYDATSAINTIDLNGHTLTLNGGLKADLTRHLRGSKTSNLVIGENFTGSNLYFSQAGTFNYLNSLEVNKSVTLGNNLQIAPSANSNPAATGFVKVADGETLTIANNQALVLTSDATGSARIAAGSEAGNYIDGKVSVHQYFPARRAWRLITAPVVDAVTINEAWQEGRVYNSLTGKNYSQPQMQAGIEQELAPEPGFGTHITRGTLPPDPIDPVATMAEGFDFGVNLANTTPSIRTFNPASGFFVNNGLVNPTQVEPVNFAPAYMLFIRGDRTINLGNSSATPTATTLRVTGNVNQGTFQPTYSVEGQIALAGNPFPSPIDFSQFATDHGSVLQPKFYVWDARLGSFGAFRTVEKVGGTYESVPYRDDIADQQLEQPQHIQSNQGFFVVPVNPSATSNIVFKEAHKSDFSRPQIFGRPISKMYINLYQRASTGSDGQLTDGVMANFDSIFSASVDNADMNKFNNFNESFFLSRAGKNLSIENRPNIAETDTLFLGFNNMSVRGYRFKFKAGNFAGQPVTAFLVDNFTKTNTHLALDGSSSQYDFSVTSAAASKSNDRFYVVFKKEKVLPVSFTQLTATRQGSHIDVAWKVTQESDIKDYTVERSPDGSSFAPQSTISARNNRSLQEAYSWLDTKPVEGYNYYRIKTNTGSSIKYTGVVRVKMGSTKTGMSFYPNPVTGRQITLQLDEMEKGIYKVEWFNQLGQQVLSHQFKHDGGTGSQVIPVGALPPGIYQMKVNGTHTFKVSVQ